MKPFSLLPALAVAFAVATATAQRPFAVAFPNLQFNYPTDIRMPPGKSDLFFVTEQIGRIRAFDPARYESRQVLVLDISDRVISGGELGLGGIVFDPDFASNGYFYLNYTIPDPLRTIISRFRVDPDNTLQADTTSEQIILEITQPGDTHNGAGVMFGPDGYLYIGMGDGECCGDPGNRAQNLDSLYGKILRIDVHPDDTSRPYSIPPDNPFVDGPGRPEIYAYGFRNPWRFSFDAATDEMWCGDVGQDRWEEIDIVRPGANYGWRLMEGPECYNPVNCDSSGLVSPIFAYEHDTVWPFGAIVAGVMNFYTEVVPGTYYPVRPGEFIFGDFVSGRIWAIERSGEGLVHTRLLAASGPNITAFGTDLDGQIFFCAFDGYIYHFTRLSGVPGPRPLRAGKIVPNPGRGSTLIQFDMLRPGHPLIELFNPLGQRIRHLDPGSLQSGPQQIVLDLHELPHGTYRWRVTLGDESISGPLVVG